LSTVQIRDIESGRVLKDWTFVDEQLQSSIYELHLAKNDISIVCKDGTAEIIAQNTSGSILKVNVVRDLLPQSFTRIQKR
jgi:hypothetical protein